MALANRYRVAPARSFPWLWVVRTNKGTLIAVKRSLNSAMDMICRREKQIADYRRRRTLASLSEGSPSTG